MKFDIVIIMPNFSVGGAQTQASNLALYIKKNVKLKVAVLGLGTNTKAYWYKTLTEKDIVCVGFSSYDFNSKRLKVAKLFKNRALSKKVLKPLLYSFFAENDVDIIVPYTLYASLIAVNVKECGLVNKIAWNHRGGNNNAGIDYTPFVNRVKQQVDFWVANSNNGGQFLKDTFNINKVYIQQNFLEVTKTAHTNFKVDTSKFNALHVANFSPEKDYKTLFKIIKEVVKEYSNIHFYIFGNFINPKSKEEYEKLIEGLKISSFITITGNQEISIDLIRKFDLGMLSSISEGCPNVILEYMYAKRAVFASKITPITDVLQDYKTEQSFDSENLSNAKEKFLKLVNDEQLRKEIGNKNFKNVQRFTNDNTFVNFIDYLKNE